MNDDQKIQYLRRSYSAVDGLWFMKIEENYGFDKALSIDNEVWKIMPKIQARFLKSVYGLDKGIQALKVCFTEKLSLDGFMFQAESDHQNNGFRVIITKCPWYDSMVKSGRENKACQVGSHICNAEYSAWAREFGENISFEIQRQICCGSDSCLLQFGE
jgi:hypothetical protein